MEKVYDKFLRYIKFDTQSSEESSSSPSTVRQLEFAKQLCLELKNIGLSEVSVDKNGYVMGCLPSNTSKKIPTVGFIAHMDTSPEVSGKNVKPLIIENYDGGDIVLDSLKGTVLRTRDFPEIKNYIGKTLITTDGNTLLGADDKAGISEIVHAVEYISLHHEIEHGDIKICFTPDEEIGRGADNFNVEKLGAQFAYTVDGGEIGELEYENFNAAAAKLTIFGVNVHPGYAKGKMINSMNVANEFMNMLPKDEIPEATSGYEGFYHLVSMNGNIEETNLSYIIRDFCEEKFEYRKNFMLECVNKLKKTYGSSIAAIDIREQYRNMKKKIKQAAYVVDIAKKAMEISGVKPKISPIRGGTDGARLSFMGLPTPNIFTGGHNFHGRYEYIPVFAMEKASRVIVNIVKLTLDIEKILQE